VERLLTYCAVLGYVSIGIGEFTALLVPSLGGHERGIAILSLSALAALQLAGLRVSSRFQEVNDGGQVRAFLTVVVAAMVFAPGIPRGDRDRAAGVVALRADAASGRRDHLRWMQSALYFSEEDRDPNRNLPRAMKSAVSRR